MALPLSRTGKREAASFPNEPIYKRLCSLYSRAITAYRERLVQHMRKFIIWRVLACDPRLIVANEPTTTLDVTIPIAL
jgi:ABC-type oligopeptide transport system ATPase subunit